MAQRTLYKLMNEHMETNEIRLLCKSLGVDFENLSGGDVKIMKALALQEYMERRRLYPKLVNGLAELRPDLDLTPHGGPPQRSTSPAPPVIEPSRAAGSVSPPTLPVSEGMRYQNFDVRVRAAQGDGSYPIQVTVSPAGESREVQQPSPLADAAFLQGLADLGVLQVSPQQAKAFGQQLREFLFPPEVWRAFDSSMNRLNGPKEGLRIRLKIDPPELSRLPWEYCFDESYDFLATDPRTPIVRYVDEPFAALDLQAPEPLRVLLALASPVELPPLRVEEEAQRVQAALAPLGERVAVEVLEHATWGTLQRALLAHEPHIFHFVGHGSIGEDGQGSLALENPNQTLDAVDASRLRVLFRGRGVKVVLLTACQTAQPEGGAAIMGVAPSLVRAQIPAVIAMQFAVPEDAALGFSRDLYGFLADGLPLDRAVTEMRVAAFGTGRSKLSWGIPVLFMRAPDGVIWQPSGKRRTQNAEREPSQQGPIGAHGGAPTGQQGGVNFSNVSGSINIGGSVVGGDLTITNHPPATQAATLTELVGLVSTLRQQALALSGLPEGDAQDLATEVEKAHTLLTQPTPDSRRVARALNNVAEILELAPGPDAARLLDEVRRAVGMAKQVLEG